MNTETYVKKAEFEAFSGKVSEWATTIMQLIDEHNAMGLAIEALIGSHPDPAVIHQHLFAALAPDRMPRSFEGDAPLQTGWHGTAHRLLELVTTRLAQIQAEAETKN